MERLPSTGPNAEQITYWNDAAAPKWITYQRILDEQIRPLGLAVMDRAAIRSGERVLDVGCGCGDTSLELSRRVGADGSVVGIDIATPMLERAKQNAAEAGVTNVRFENADAQTQALPAGAFDLVFSRFGVMFFATPAAAFRNLRSALRDGGRVGFVCWQPIEKNPWMGLPMMAASKVIAFPPRPPADAPGPFAFAEPGRVRAILADAGFGDVAIEGLDTVLTIGDGDLDRSVDFIVQMGPTGMLLREKPEAKEAVVGAVKKALAGHHTERGLGLDGSVWLVSARR